MNVCRATAFLALFMFQLAIASKYIKNRRKRSATECPMGVEEPNATFRVFLTVNALAQVSWTGRVDKRKIELNWTLPPDSKPGDWVGLFRRNPRLRGLTRVLVKVDAFEHNGSFKTKYMYPHNPLLGMKSPTAMCLYGFWIAYVRDNRPIIVNCLRIRPNWMWEERQSIGDLPLHALMIPGTHNSGAYEEFQDTHSISILKRFTVNHGEDVWNQLLYGIRYLDLRVGYYEHTPEKFWVVHDFVKINPLYEIVQDVRRFMKVTKEMVIMDFHRFPTGFDDEMGDIHAQLVEYLIGELGEFMAPDWLGRSVTPNDLWHMNKTLIVTYSHDPRSLFSDVLWSDVRHVWGNKPNIEDLFQFLSEAMRLRRWARYPWAAMTHLTPSKLDVILSPTSGIREMSDEIAKNVTQWYRDMWWNSANIVATDFFLGNNIIEESIIANRRRKKCRRNFRW